MAVRYRVGVVDCAAGAGDVGFEVVAAGLVGGGRGHDGKFVGGAVDFAVVESGGYDAAY